MGRWPLLPMIVKAFAMDIVPQSRGDFEATCDGAGELGKETGGDASLDDVAAEDTIEDELDAGCDATVDETSDCHWQENAESVEDVHASEERLRWECFVS